MFQMGNWNPDVLNFQDYYCSGYMFMEMISREEKTQLVGVTIIVDGSNFGFKQARNFTLEDMRYSARTLQVRSYSQSLSPLTPPLVTRDKD